MTHLTWAVAVPITSAMSMARIFSSLVSFLKTSWAYPKEGMQNALKGLARPLKADGEVGDGFVQHPDVILREVEVAERLGVRGEQANFRCSLALGPKKSPRSSNKGTDTRAQLITGGSRACHSAVGCVFLSSFTHAACLC